MTQPQSKLKGDRIVESLERGEHWFTQHRVKLAVIAGAFIISAFATQAYQNQRRETQSRIWNEASKLTTTEQKVEFVAKNPSAEATPFLILLTGRQLLEEGKFAEAESLTSQFISGFSTHPRLSAALMIRAYAREEQGKFNEARTDYQKVQGMDEKMDQLLSTQALARLP